MKYFICILVIISAIFSSSCSSEDTKNDTSYTPTPATLQVPLIFQQKLLPPVNPSDNPLTEEGIALGRKLFFDPILSADNTQSCASCHNPRNAFTDSRAFSDGIDGVFGTRNSMPLYNMAWNYDGKFFWDGRAQGLEEQALEPVTNPIEMHNTWANAAASLEDHPEYPLLFEQAFGATTIDSTLVTKAISQFTRTLISGNSKFDRYLLGEEELTASEQNGFNVFMDETKGDCFHCHGSDNNPLWTDNVFHNNGLDEVITDRGLGAITGDPREFGLFKSPSLRNLAYTAPYMHDGRFATLEEVIDHYSEGLVYSETIDPLMKNVARGGVQITSEEKADLKAFLLSLSEPGFTTNPAFQNPN